MTLNGTQVSDFMNRNDLQISLQSDVGQVSKADDTWVDLAAVEKQTGTGQNPLAISSAKPGENLRGGPDQSLVEAICEQTADTARSDILKAGKTHIAQNDEKQNPFLKDPGAALADNKHSENASAEQTPEFVRQWLSERKAVEQRSTMRQPTRNAPPDSGFQMDTVVKKTQAVDPDGQKPHVGQSFRGSDLPALKQDSLVQDPAATQENGPVPQMHARAFSSDPVGRSDILPKDQPPASISRDTQTDVIQQIVQKMTLRSHGQQSRMQIKLKPEFLGDIRMQIMTQNQHVTVRMIADSHAVKEIIEQNMHQLKNELQQHGLQIDKFEVLVGQDDDWKNHSHQSAFQQARQRRSYRMSSSGGSQADGNAASDSAAMDSTQKGKANQVQLNGIDYFA
jgi:flagellar hook-length control protein FliK